MTGIEAQEPIEGPFVVTDDERGKCVSCESPCKLYQVVGPMRPGEDMGDSMSFQSEDEAEDRCAAFNTGYRAGLELARELVELIDNAGLLNLTRGVQLGATSWYCKTEPALAYLRARLAKIAR